MFRDAEQQFCSMSGAALHLPGKISLPDAAGAG
jgi:hypothetical protein